MLSTKQLHSANLNRSPWSKAFTALHNCNGREGVCVQGGGVGQGWGWGGLEHTEEIYPKMEEIKQSHKTPPARTSPEDLQQ